MQGFTLAVLSAFIVLGCGPINISTSSASPENSVGTIVGSCTFASSGQCTDYGQTWTTTSIASACTAGSASTASCPVASRVGTCYNSAQGIAVRYYSPSFNAVSAQNACATTSGSWVPG
jgi:hypothetical protein